MYSSLLASTMMVVWKALESYELEPAALFTRAGLDTSRLEDPNARYRYEPVRRLWELAVAETGDPCFGLTAAQHWHPSNFHGLGYAWLASGSLKDALERLIRYFRIVTTDPEELRLVQHAEEYEFRVDTSKVQYRALDVEYDLLLALLMDACRISAGEAFAARRVSLQRTRPSCADRFEAFFGAEVRYGADANSVYFDRLALERQLPTGNLELARANETVVQTYLAHLDRSDVVMRVKVALLEHLPSGHVSEEEIAQGLHLSLRTLQRKLRDEGTSYKELLDETRRELATEYIKNPHVSISEITYLLGFSEPSNFSRAFKRWTGSSPSAFRAMS
jgi:AraC-like DNA-binding protein